MKNSIYFILFISSILFFSSCGDGQQKRDMRQSGPTAVVSTTIPATTITTYRNYPTSIEGVINAEIRPKISGYITEVLVDEGQKVKKGQVLFRLETATLTQQAKAAKANINVAEVKVNQLKPLVEQEIVSKNQLATAKAKLEQAKSNYQSIKAQIDYATIKSPVDGYVGSIRIRKGNLVSPNSQQPLTTVTDISEVYAYFSMNEKDYLDFLMNAKGENRKDKIKNLPKVNLILANEKVYAQEGTIQTVNSQINPLTGSVSFRAVFDNPNKLLTNGSTGVIKIPHIYKNAIVIPQKATYELQDKTFAVKVSKTDSGTIAQTNTITVIDKMENLFIVSGGLKKGDQIIVEDVATIESGIEVNPSVLPFDSIIKPVPTVFIKD